MTQVILIVFNLIVIISMMITYTNHYKVNFYYQYLTQVYQFSI